MVFSSSATVYGVPERLPLTEDAALGYGDRDTGNMLIQVT